MITGKTAQKRRTKFVQNIEPKKFSKILLQIGPLVRLYSEGGKIGVLMGRTVDERGKVCYSLVY